MELTELYAHVEARLPVDVTHDGATVVQALLTALAARLTPDEAHELGSELPDELADILAHAHGDGELSRDELVEDLARRLDVDDDEAELVATAALAVIRAAIEPTVEIDQVLESLPADLARLMS